MGSARGREWGKNTIRTELLFLQTQPSIGVILAQIGTPEKPETKSVRSYLRRFLSDRRIVDTNPWLWQPVLRGIILRTRPRKSARLYRQIWSEEGSPLLVNSLRQQAGLQEILGPKFQVELGLAYSEHSMERTMRRFEQRGIGRVLVVPLFPQYSSTTTASVYDQACFAALGRTSSRGPAPKRYIPALRFVEPYYKEQGYISAMKSHLLRHLKRLDREPDGIVLSFHGIPKRYADTGDPYPEQCMETGRLLAEAMGWREDQWQVAFQSRFGPEEWIGPSTAVVIGGLAERGIANPLVFAPGFVTDCLETLYELDIEGRNHFSVSGGQAEQFQYAPCLNDQPEWLEFLAGLVERNAAGW
ncbi:ferrochelatase [Paenibacillus sp. M1]|uniref:Coproporphyrin III ferrochelatase n=1 Tax=Paenibacillus haidiansis TaxID=1574488 RepID=A0ABU7VY34_9BACL